MKIQRSPSRRRGKVLALAGVAAVAAATPAFVAVSGLTASASGPSVSLSSPYEPLTSAAGVPSANQGTITGTGFTPGATVYVQVCNGVNPVTTNGYSPNSNCAQANAATIASSTGAVSINTALPSFQFEGPFHGEDPSDAYFNCLAPADNPNGPTTVVGAKPIDPALASWGSAKGPSTEGGGGTAPCQLRISTEVGAYQSSDLYIPLTDLDGNGASPAPAVPAAPTITAGAPGSGTVSAAFTAPATGGTYSSFLVVATDQTQTSSAPVSASGTTSPVTLSGLVSGNAYTFTVTAVNANGSATSLPSAAFTIPATATKPSISGAPGVAVAGRGYGFAFTTGGTTPKYVAKASGTLPPGLTLATSGVLSGVPSKAGTFPFVVEVANSAGDAFESTSVTVVHGAASRLRVVTGNSRTVAEGRAFPTLEVRVTDAYGNVVPGDRVTFRVTGPAAFAGRSSASAASNTTGVAKAPRLVAKRATGTVRVRVTGAGSSSVTFTLHVSK